MKSIKILITAILILSGQLLFSQKTDNPWEKWKFLIGEWVGEGNGQPGQGEGSFSFQTNLDGKILVRNSHTVFPATANSPVKVHYDLLIVYPGTQGEGQEAVYFDNEGHTIKYKVSFTENSIILTSESEPKVPIFRLSYVPIDKKTVTIDFEMAPPDKPGEFRKYLSGKASKVK